ncbi:MAG TPA: hypothetical protein VJ373_07410 [Desulfatiglandales bacterium]|nr:hypothetical protein [Desulfatiglandales bacterium]
MKPDIRFTDRPLEDLWCQAVTVLVFQSPSVKMDVLSGLNEKMTGTMANILEGGRWTGNRGEDFLFAGEDMIKSDKLLFHGLGPISEFSTSLLEEELWNLGSTLDKLGVNDFGIHVPVIHGLEAGYGSHLELSAKSLLKRYYEKHKDEPDYHLKIIFSVGIKFMDILDPVVERLRSYLDSIPDFSIIIDRNRMEDDGIK